jgi:MFS family permease
MSPGPVVRDPSYGWVMVFAVFVLSALSFGALGSVSVFLKPLSTEFGWSRGETAFGYTVISFSSALFGILWGYIADRYGSRYFGFVAAVAMTASLFLLSKNQSIYQFYALYFLFGAFGNAMLTSPLYANVGFWFQQRPGLALGITAAGGAVGQGIMPLCAGLAISAYGWQNAYVILAISYFCIAFPIAFLIRESPTRQQAAQQQTQTSVDFPLNEKQVVAWISGAIIFCCICMAVPIVHLVPLLTDRGHSVEFATGVLMMLMFSGAFGRILGGRLGDSIGALPAYMLMSLGQTVSVVWFPHITNEWFLYGLAVFFGFTYSGVMSCILVCTRIMVSAGFAARAMSITSFFGWIGMGLGGYLGGRLFDLQGSYTTSFAFAMAMGLINLVILGLFALHIRSARITQTQHSM